MSMQEIIRAWRDAEYRESLSANERASLLELPVGLIELNDLELDAVAGAAKPTTSCGSHHVCCGKFSS